MPARSTSTWATAGRFADDDLLPILRHRATGQRLSDLVVCDESYSVQPGTSA
ncbi:hypothetical protein OG689_42060 [Kitasatospora sp. NBC_00240]|uniref:hypothetical protein n=1 Tax=Kitasatospora sp. NBC_00240 TaxID=2903567 RepID=UPI00225896A4|nr:hypothetical protein [Kitasatospora sp. NBC_00240]MCX5215742.1 hypothetical protein [Kitasatospora sp. NBC_00240]